MIGSNQEECTPVPEHVSVDNSNESSSASPFSPVTLESSSPSAKKHLFRDQIMSDTAKPVHQSVAASGREDNSMVDSEMYIQDKIDEIMMCLEGVPTTMLTSEMRKANKHGIISNTSIDDKAVDIWHLRQLALTKGGLLNAAIRKQVWLKLVDANEDILMSPITISGIQGESKLTEDARHIPQLSDHEIEMIKMDIKRCIWNIEAEMKNSKISQGLGNDSTGDDTSLASFESATGMHSPNHPPGGTRLSPIYDDNTQASQETTFTESKSSIKSGSVATSRITRRKRQERSLLLNIISSVLRTNPDETAEFDMERLFYFPGMHNVVAPILVTLESPSLTSLVMKRLSQYHLKDSMMSTFVEIQSTIRAMLMPLLAIVDKSLHDILMKANITDPCAFALRWVLCWFASDISNYEIISRLFDVFLVSHYTCPIYVSVAMLTFASNRSKIVTAAQNDDSHLTELISSLPSIMVSNQSQVEVMDSFEKVIENALTYIHEVSPTRLIHFAQKSSDELVSSSSLKIVKKGKIRYRPSWTYKCTAPTDWDLIQEAKRVRGLSPNSRTVRRQVRQLKIQELEMKCQSVPNNELAIDASGLEDRIQISRRSKRNRRAMKLVLYTAFTVISSLFLRYQFETQRGWDLHTESVRSIPLKQSIPNASIPIIRNIPVVQIVPIISVEPNTTRKIDDRSKINPMKNISSFNSTKLSIVILESIEDPNNIAQSVKILGHAIVNDMKQYVKKDPDLFIIMN